MHWRSKPKRVKNKIRVRPVRNVQRSQSNNQKMVNSVTSVHFLCRIIHLTNDAKYSSHVENPSPRAFHAALLLQKSHLLPNLQQYKTSKTANFALSGAYCVPVCFSGITWIKQNNPYSKYFSLFPCAEKPDYFAIWIKQQNSFTN